MILRRALCFVALATALTSSTRSHAADKDACIESAERAQHLRNDQHLVAARDALRICAQPDCPAIVAQDCTQWLGQVEASVPTLRARAFDAMGAPLDDVHVTIDGAPLSNARGAASEVDPGLHALHFEHPGFEPLSSTVTVRTGERDRVVSVTMRPLPPPPSHTNPAVYVFAGAGVLALGSFVYFGLSGRADEHTMKTTCAPYCSGSSVDTLRAKYIIADVSLVVALLSGGAATWFALAHPANDARP